LDAETERQIRVVQNVFYIDFYCTSAIDMHDLVIGVSPPVHPSHTAVDSI